MSKRPWMPFYIGDYLADTGHLSTVEHGAYVLLITHYWMHDGLPTDDASLKNITKTSAHFWRKIKPKMRKFFDKNWKHSRIERELEKVAAVSKTRSDAAKISHQNRATHADANAEHMHTHSHSHLPSKEESKKDAPSAPLESDEVALFNRGKEILGEKAGGLIKKLLLAKDKNIALTRAALELASTKQNPSEYVAAIIRNNTPQTYSRETDPAWRGVMV